MAMTSSIILLAACLGNQTIGPQLTQPRNGLIRQAKISQCETFPLSENVSYNEVWQDGPPRIIESKVVKKRESERWALNGTTLKIVTLNDWPHSDVKINTTTQKPYGDGVAFRFVELLRKEFGFDYTVVPTVNNSAIDVLNMIVEGKADMAAAFMPIRRNGRLTYSTTLSKEEWVVLLRRPQESASGSSLLAPFDTRVWILILLSVFIVGPVIYAITVVRVRLCKGSARLSKVFSLTSCVWFVYGALMKQGSTLSPVSDSSRLLFATWWIFITVVTAFYTANLTAFLTLSRFTLPIEGPMDMAVKSFRWIGRSNSVIENVINEEDGFSYLKNSLQKGLGQFLNSSDQKLMELVREEGRMFIREKRVVDRLLFRDYLKKIEDGFEESQRCIYAVTPQPFLTLEVGFVFPRNSTLPQLFNPMLKFLVEAGIVDHLMGFDLPSSGICPLNLGSKERQLRNSDLVTTYRAVGIGLFVASVAFAGEQAIKCCLKWKNGKLQPLVKNKMKQTPYDKLAFYSWFSYRWIKALKNNQALKSFRERKNDVGVGPASHDIPGHKDINNKFRTYNGNEYIKVFEDGLNGLGITKLIPIRGPSAVLFERVHRGGNRFYSRQNEWKGSLNVI